MKDKDRVTQKKRNKHQTHRLVNIPVLQKTMACPSCGGEIEIWADEEKSLCTWCGYHIISNNRRTH